MSELSELYVHTIDTLVLSGGGVRAGPLFAGVLTQLVEELTDLDYTSRTCRIRRVRGTSMGSVVGLFIAMRVSPKDLCAFVLQVPIDSFVQWDMKNLITHYGFNNGNGVEALISSIMQSNIGHPNPTFKDLYDRTGIALEVVVTDVDNCTPVVLSPEATPGEYVSQAILASTAIPFFFAPRRLRTPLDDTPHYCVDGAVTLNYAQSGLDPQRSLGFHIVTTPGANSNDEKTAPPHEKLGMYRNLMQYISQFIRLLISLGEPQQYVIPTVRVPLPDQRLNVMSLETMERADLISQGHTAARRFISSHTIIGKTREISTQTGL